MSTVGISAVDLLRRLREGVARSAESVRASSTDPSADPLRREAASERTHLLGLLLAGAGSPELASVAPDVVGYGSRIVLEDRATGETAVHYVMNSLAMDLDAGHISMDSPLGWALQGKRVGDVVQVDTPVGRRTFVIRELVTLPELLDRMEEDEPIGAAFS